ncbi:PREDICTED: zinc finger protein 83-like isoform X2 [Diuraphis noxia]|uniref:zinc finger protein 83-like isoform X2 n=1 Tax=Diuraphis noxia TaxID=143948 RepID=UPI0007635AFD|nr:PREDICTED: zinc finger protein 83-like isoform X2 [Diuraphis noxia]
MLSSTNNNIDTEKWQEILLDEIQSNHENNSKNKLPLSPISMINDHTSVKQDINLYDIQSDIENSSDNELPLSSIANVLLPIDTCKVEKSKVVTSESIGFQFKIDVDHNTSDSSKISIKEPSKIDKPIKKYGCDICGKIFFRRFEIIEHFRTSLCFPESPFDLEHNSPTYYLYNNSENSIAYCNNISNLKTNHTQDMNDKCRICQDVIRNDNFIKKHQILHTKKNNLCNVCSVLNSIACGNNQHLKEKYTWKCKTCGQSFTKLSVLKTHICIFPKNKLFNCNKCHKSFKKLNALEKHKVIHTLHCNICYKQFFKQSSLKDHKRTHDLRSINQYNIRLKFLNYSALRHTKEVCTSSKKYECSRCSRVFYKRSEIVCHIFENHQEDYSKYSCDECTNICDSSRDYILRLGKNHFKCDVCPQSFTTSHRLQQHYGWHLGINNFKCEFCPKTFSKCSLYLSHEKNHTGERPFRCNFCGKWFPESSNLNIHLKPYKLFACDICQKPYTQMSSLLLHKRLHSKEKFLENKSCHQLSTMEVRTRRQCSRRKQFKCNMCTKLFYHSWSLNAHLKTHQNNKNRYKSSTCTCCLKVFDNLSSLKRHYRYMQQKNNKLFDCDICKISFMCSTSLNEHRKNHAQFEKNTPLNYNVNNDINTVNEEYKCDLCMKSFLNQAQIFSHILETHY